MKRTSLVILSLAVVSSSCAAPLFADQDQRIIPAGSLISCTLSEPKVSSKTTAVGDPVLCQLSHSEHYGRSVLPYKSYLEGRFEDYKDPGHFVGKGWMQLKFDRMIIEPDTVIPVDARVVDVPGYRVDNQGRILGKGHATRDTVLWSIPILWPVDLMMLPMRGPRPTLKEETHLTLKVMDDLAVPVTPAPQPDIYGLQHRQPMADNEPPPAPDQQPSPEMADAAPQYPQPDQQLQNDNQNYNQDYNYVAPVAPPVVAYGPGYYPPPAYAYGSYGYGFGGYGGSSYGYAGRPYGAYRSSGLRGPGYRPYGYGGAPRAYGSAGGARPFGAGAAQRSYGYAGAGYAGASRGYAGASRGYAGGTRGYGGGGYGGGRASMGGRGGAGGGRR